MKSQYGTDDNLATRIRIKKQFSTGKQGWANFLLQNYCLKSHYRVLELGCGNAVFWKAVSEKVPTGIKLTLSDFSVGMLDAAKSNTRELDFIENYAVIDAQNIPFDDNSFDIVIANYMLYHVPNVQKALHEISRILKPGGVFYTATFGKNNLKEVGKVFNDFDSKIDSVLEDLTDVFGLENGAMLLGNYFASVNLNRFENHLRITESDSFVDYFLSYQGMGNVSDIIFGDRKTQFCDYLRELFSVNNSFDITQEEGLFICHI